MPSSLRISVSKPDKDSWFAMALLSHKHCTLKGRWEKRTCSQQHPHQYPHPNQLHSPVWRLVDAAQLLKLEQKEKCTEPVRTAYNIILQTNPNLALSVRGNGQSRLALDILLTQIYIPVRR